MFINTHTIWYFFLLWAVSRDASLVGLGLGLGNSLKSRDVLKGSEEVEMQTFRPK